MSVAVAEVAQASCRQKVKEWYREQIASWTEVDIPSLAKVAKDTFKTDKEFVSAFLEEVLEDMMYSLALQVVAETRRFKVVDETPASVFNDPAAPAAKPRTAPRQVKVKRGYEVMFENISANVTKKVLEMTKEDLLAAAAQRGKAARAHFNYGALWTRLAGGMNDTERVRDRYSVDEIEALMDEIEKGN